MQVVFWVQFKSLHQSCGHVLKDHRLYLVDESVVPDLIFLVLGLSFENQLNKVKLVIFQYHLTLGFWERIHFLGPGV
jgi:hypothetical protein